MKGKLSTKKRLFEQIAADLRETVCSVVRHRHDPSAGTMAAFPLGSGFFISPKVFATCYHVFNSKSLPHQDGDTYHLVNNLPQGAQAGHQVFSGVHELKNVVVGQQLFLDPDHDFAILKVEGRPDQPYAALDYGSVPEGMEIGVAGYPQPRLTVISGQLRYDTLLYRVAKNVVTANYQMEINADQLPQKIVVPVVEVNFLFVPGNSGGPIFRADNGAVVAFVHGYNAQLIREAVATAKLATIPPGMSNQYVETIHAVYSLGIKMDCVKPLLQQHGVSL